MRIQLYLHMLNLGADNEKYKNKYRIASARLTGWDYRSNGLYYITICTLNRTHYFGEIVGLDVETQNIASLNVNESKTQNIASLQKTPIAEIAEINWLDIPKHFPFVELDEFVLMPNHIHGILYFNNPDKIDWKPNKFGVQSQNLGSVIRGFKASVKTYATINNIEFGWQPRYYDHIIRNEREYLNISNYIFDNPMQGLLNGDNEDNLYIP